MKLQHIELPWLCHHQRRSRCHKLHQEAFASTKVDDWTFEVKPKKDALSSGDERVLVVRKKLWNQTLQDLLQS
jgi:hypothetical protein